MTRRRRGSARRPSGVPRQPGPVTTPPRERVRASPPRSRSSLLPILVAIGALAVAAVAFVVVARPFGAPAPTAGGGNAGAGCPTSQPPVLPAGERRIVTIETALGSIELTIEANLSPIAAGNFVALASCGYYDGVGFHRVVPNFVIQGGDPTGTGGGGPGYNIQDEPVTSTYQRGTVAMARSPGPNSVGSQFFIVLDDGAQRALTQPGTGNYQIIGSVAEGMEVADAIAAAADGEQPTNPVTMTDVRVARP
jgi:peptidyl-prolyl cis-trans isomerase B (cyclophilin B)